MKKFFSWGIVLSILFVACQANKEEENQKGDSTVRMNYDCTHCGMPSQEFPQNQSYLIASGEQKWFCSSRCLFLGKEDQEIKENTIEELKVVDYYTNTRIDGKTAFYVVGSDVLGPMGNDFIAHETLEAAEDFKKEHQGKAVYAYEDINTQRLKEALSQ